MEPYIDAPDEPKADAEHTEHFVLRSIEILIGAGHLHPFVVGAYARILQRDSRTQHAAVDAGQDLIHGLASDMGLPGQVVGS